MTVAARTVVEDLDVVECIGPGQLPGLVDSLADTLFLQAAEKRLPNRIVPIVATAARAGQQVVIATEPFAVITSKLT